MRFYSLGEVCALFSIDAVTLRRWMRRVKVIPHVDPSDHRRRYLDQVQLGQLAEVHHRVLLLTPGSDTVWERLAHLEVQVRQLALQVERLVELFHYSVCSPTDTTAFR